MFSTRLSRVANRASAACSLPHPTSVAAAAAAQRTTQCVAAAHRSHQRRPSSSKASCPPDSSPKPAPAAKSSSAEGASPKARMVDAVLPRTGKRYPKAKRTRAAATAKGEGHFADLLAVPSIHHLPPADISISSFFSLHRPLSLTTPIPPPISPEAFDTLFEPRTKRDPWHDGNSAEGRPEDVVYALEDTWDNLQAEMNGSNDNALRWEMQEASNSQETPKHLDGVPRARSFDEVVAQLKPYRAPPPPEPFPEALKAAEKKRLSDWKQLKQRLGKARPRQKSYSTTIIVTESTAEDGQRTYTASSTPIVRLPDGETNAATIEEPASPSTLTRFRFSERMKQRQQASVARQRAEILDPTQTPSFVRRPPFARARKMLLISVKRQRKLKMKKHKYKKLMKRTRNLRRRQDRI